MSDLIDWVITPAHPNHRTPAKQANPTIWQDLNAFFAWHCLCCDSSLVGAEAQMQGLCKSCEDRLPLMIPPLCRVCGISLSSEDDICLRCRQRSNAYDGIELLRSVCLYAGIGQDVMQIAKSESGRSLGRLWARLAAGYIPELWEPGMAIVGAPASAKNFRQRGFDQVDLILQALPSPWRESCIHGLMLRADGQSQKMLDRVGRSTNLQNRLRLRANRGVPTKVLLIDDVCTTGATLSTCAAVLKAAGCQQVRALTIFRD